MNRPGVVTGLRSEADCLDAAPTDERILSACAGGSPGRACADARRLLDAGATGLVSFGIAGGLAPELKPGDLIVADRVLAVSGLTYETDPVWSETLRRRAAPAAGGTVATVERPVRSVSEKSRLAALTGAAAADMESAGVAEAASSAEVPFVIVRAIADPASRALPPAALVGLAPDGSTRPFAVLRELLFRPWDLPALLRLGNDTSTALKRLRGVAARGLVRAV